MIRLVCGHRGKRRPVIVFAYDGPVPIPDGYAIAGPHTSIELRCRYCGYSPRPGNEMLRILLVIAAGEPGQRLDINPRRSHPSGG